MTFRDRDIARLNRHEAGMMQRGQHMGQLHQRFEIRNRAIAPSAFQIAHKRRAVYGGEDLMLAADPDRAIRVPGVLGELGGRCLAEMPDKTTLRPNAGVFHIRPRLAPDLQRHRVFAKLKPDFLNDPVGLILDPGQPLLAEKFKERDLAGDVGGGRRRLSRPALTAPRPSSGSDLGHSRLR